METKQLVVTFDKGLNEQYEASTTPVSTAQTLQNWIPEPTGALRCRIGWSNASTTSAPATRRVRGIGYLPIAAASYYVVADDDGTNIDIWRIDKSNLAAGTWSNIGSNAITSSNTKHVSFATGLSNVFYVHEGLSTVNRWDGTTHATIAGSQRGTAIAFHKNRLFTGGGGNTNVTRLHFSDLGDYTTWGANSYISVGQADGERIEALCSFDGGLLIGKENSLWFLTGAGPDDFELHQLDAGGCAPGHTIVATPYGAVICGKEIVYLWEGGTPAPISLPIENTYGLTGAYLSAAYQNGSLYVTDASSAVTCVYDFVSRAWHTEALSSANESPAVLFAQGPYLFGGPKQATTGSLLWYRQFPSSARAKDALLTETFLAYTPEIWLGTAARRVTLRHIYLQLRQRGGDATQTGITVTPYRNGSAGTAQTITPKGSAQVFRKRLDFGGDAYSVQLRFSQTVGAAEASLTDIERVVIEYDEESES